MLVQDARYSKVLVRNLGCKTNFADLASIVGKMGIKVVHKPEEAEFAIINSCVVTADAERETLKLLRRLKKLGLKVVVSGCMVGLSPEKLKDADLLIHHEEDIECDADLLVKGVKELDRTRAYIKIQEGCSRRCTFCAIPRGKPRSLPLTKIIETAELLADKGYQEVVLVGTHLALWGEEFGQNLSHLLKEFAKKITRLRLRLSSLSPGEITEELIDAMVSASEILCPHFHIPVQSGDDEILKLMGRWHTFEDFVNDCERLLKAFQSACIGTDVIAGFPGEDDMSFERTCQNIASLPLGYLHIFPFSPRPGTLFEHVKVDGREIKGKVKHLLKIAKEKRKKFVKRFIGEMLLVLPEVKIKRGFIGTSRNYIKVKVKGMTVNGEVGVVPEKLAVSKCQGPHMFFLVSKDLNFF